VTNRSIFWLTFVVRLLQCIKHEVDPHCPSGRHLSKKAEKYHRKTDLFEALPALL